MIKSGPRTECDFSNTSAAGFREFLRYLMIPQQLVFGNFLRYLNIQQQQTNNNNNYNYNYNCWFPGICMIHHNTKQVFPEISMMPELAPGCQSGFIREGGSCCRHVTSDVCSFCPDVKNWAAQQMAAKHIRSPDVTCIRRKCYAIHREDARTCLYILSTHLHKYDAHLSVRIIYRNLHTHVNTCAYLYVYVQMYILFRSSIHICTLYHIIFTI